MTDAGVTGAGVVLAPGSDVMVRLLKSPRPQVRYPAVVLFDDANQVVVRAPWAGPARDLGFVRFEPGDVFTEHFWRDRWYAVKEVRARDGGRKGWYCDVTRPATVAPDELVVVDLDLDLWRSADGTSVLRLDEDEFRGSGLTERDPAAAASAWQALEELERLAGHGFAPILPPGWPR